MTRYSLTCRNNARTTGHFCVFQTPPRINPMPGRLFPTAWLVKAAAPGTSVTFAWTTDHGFAWWEEGSLADGATFRAGQVWPAALNGHNAVDLHVDRDGVTSFANACGGGAPGWLTILQSGAVPPGRTWIGLAMAGSPVCAIQAGPNLKAMFKPDPACLVTFGRFAAGQIIREEELPGHVLPVPFHGARRAATVELGGDNILVQTV